MGWKKNAETFALVLSATSSRLLAADRAFSYAPVCSPPLALFRQRSKMFFTTAAVRAPFRRKAASAVSQRIMREKVEDVMRKSKMRSLLPTYRRIYTCRSEGWCSRCRSASPVSLLQAGPDHARFAQRPRTGSRGLQRIQSPLTAYAQMAPTGEDDQMDMTVIFVTGGAICAFASGGSRHTLY